MYNPYQLLQLSFGIKRACQELDLRPFDPYAGIEKDLDEKKLSMIYRETKEFMKSLQESRTALQAKSALLIVFFVYFISFFCFLLLKNQPELSLKMKVMISSILVLYYYHLFILFKKTFLPKVNFILGNHPVNLCEKSHLKNQYSVMVISQLMDYQDRINENMKTKNKISQALTSAVIGFFVSPVASFVITSLIFLFV